MEDIINNIYRAKDFYEQLREIKYRSDRVLHVAKDSKRHSSHDTHVD